VRYIKKLSSLITTNFLYYVSERLFVAVKTNYLYLNVGVHR
jgi:hypothetical protein